MTNKPKGKLFALLAVFAAIGIVTATGAFTSVTAQRTAAISTAGDSSALLGLEEQGDTGYIDTQSSELRINFDNVGSVNDNATTWLNKSIKITNNGDNDVWVWVTHDGDGGSFAIYNGTDRNISAVDGNTPPKAAKLSTASSVVVSIQVDTNHGPSVDVTLPSTVTFHAEDSKPTGSTEFTPTP